MGRFAETAQEENQEQPSKKRADSIQRGKLTEEEVKLLDEGKTDIHKLAAERRRLRNTAEAELNRMVTTDKERSSVITLKEYKDLRSQLNATESPEETKKILEKIHEIQKDKEKEKGLREGDTKKLDPEDEKLLELQKEFDNICDENEHLIGTKQLKGFKAWFAEERRRNPTIKHLREQIKRLEGKEITDRNGLFPRREEYKTLQLLFKKYHLGEPIDNEWIAEEGLSERKKFRQNAEAMERHLQHQKDTGFYSPEVITSIMEEVLTAENPQSQQTIIRRAEKIAQKESESFTYLDNTINIRGKHMRKMSFKSKKILLDSYKKEGFDGRETTDWKKLVEYEGNLARQMEEIYGTDTKGLHLALSKFENLDFMQKQESLKENQTLVAKNKEKDKLHKELILEGVESALSDAEKDNTISEKTAQRYRDLFANEDNYKNPETGKPGDLKVLQKMYETLISPTPKPEKENRNLAAYKQKRDEFVKDLAELGKLKPDMDENELNEWQENYDKESWSKRERLHIKLRTEKSKAEREKGKKDGQEGEAGIKEKDKKEAKEFKKEKTEIIEAATVYMSEDNPREALKILMLFDEQNPDDKQILFLIEMAAKQLRQNGSKNKVDEDYERELEREIAEAAAKGQNKKDIEEENVIHLKIVGAKQSEQRHDKQKQAKTRAEDESLERMPGNSIEEDLVEDYYEKTDDSHFLNEDATGEEVNETKIEEIPYTDAERHEEKVDVFEKQDRITHREGLFTQFTDKSGRIISAEEAEQGEDQFVQDIADNLAEESQERMEAKQAAKTPIGSILETQRQVAAQRKAREFVDKKINERIKDAA